MCTLVFLSAHSNYFDDVNRPPFKRKSPAVSTVGLLLGYSFMSMLLLEVLIAKK